MATQDQILHVGTGLADSVFRALPQFKKPLQVFLALAIVMELVAPILLSSSLGPLSFLTAVVVIVIFARFVLRKAAAAAVLTFALIPLGQAVGVHPGVLLLCILMANECFLFSYQDGSYLLSYLSTDGRVFSHSQAKRVLAAKMLATFAAVAISVPYWRLLGFIQ